MKKFAITQSITDRSTISIIAYLRDINRYPLLTPEEEAKILHGITLGGHIAECAKKRLVEGYLRFVITVAKQYKQECCGLELEDLISEGNIGLIKAAETYNPACGIKFTSYSVWWIRQSILAATDKYSTTLRLPSNKMKLLLAYRKLDQQMLLQKQRHITLQEFCDARGITEQCAVEVIAASLASVRLDLPIAEDSETTLADMTVSYMKTDSSLERESFEIDLYDAITHTLKSKEADIFSRYYGVNGHTQSTLQTIADDLGLSYERTRQILIGAQNKLKQSKYSNNLSSYLAA